MKDVLRKSFALLLCLTMVLSLFPAAFAEDGIELVGDDALGVPEIEEVAGDEPIDPGDADPTANKTEEENPSDSSVGDGVLDVPETSDEPEAPDDSVGDDVYPQDTKPDVPLEEQTEGQPTEVLIDLAFRLEDIDVFEASEKYNRSAVATYAKAHWNDNVGLCAAFASACIGKGGIYVTGQSAGGSDNYSYVEPLLQWLVANNYGSLYPLVIEKNNSGIVNINKQTSPIDVGDLIFYWLKDEDIGNILNPCHVSVVSNISSNGLVQICAHNSAYSGNLAYYERGSTRSYAYMVFHIYDDLTPPSPNLTVTANQATNITEDNATLTGYINFGNYQPTHWGVDLGTSGNNLPNVVFADDSKHVISATSGTGCSISFNVVNDGTICLLPDTTYFYRFWVKYGNDQFVHSEVKNFTTKGASQITPPRFTTPAVEQGSGVNNVNISSKIQWSSDAIPVEWGLDITTQASDDTFMNVDTNFSREITASIRKSNPNGIPVNLDFAKETAQASMLAPGTVYRYRFWVRYQVGNDDRLFTHSNVGNFTTVGSTATVSKSATYNNHTYERYDTSISWTEAKAFCESKGGHLATISGKAENDWITTTLLNGCAKNIYFIGATDSGDNKWKWITGEAFSYTNWDTNSNRPEPTDDSGEDYGAIMGKQVGNNKSPGEWIDIFNTGDTRYTGYALSDCGFICEYEPKLPDKPVVTVPKTQYPAGSTITLSWTASAHNDYYWITVYRDNEIIIDQNTSALYYTLTNAPSGSYVVYVRANNSAGASDSSSCAFTVKDVHTFRFDANGGSGSMESVTGCLGDTVSWPANSFTRPGYHFKGWNAYRVNDGTYHVYYGWHTEEEIAQAGTQKDVYMNGLSFTLDNSWTNGVSGPCTIIMYAVWEADSYTVTFDANGGSGAPVAQVKAHGQAIKLSSTMPAREGFTFLGWATSASAMAAEYQPGDTYSADASLTLYAVWKQNTAPTAPARISGLGAEFSDAMTLKFYVKDVPETVTPVFEVLLNDDNNRVLAEAADETAYALSNNPVYTAAWDAANGRWEIRVKVFGKWLSSAYTLRMYDGSTAGEPLPMKGYAYQGIGDNSVAAEHAYTMLDYCDVMQTWKAGDPAYTALYNAVNVYGGTMAQYWR